jgi:hypothetical protein
MSQDEGLAEAAVREPLSRDQLPGGTVIDSLALDRAVIKIAGIYTKRGLETAISIGRYVLDTFFAGDFESFRREGKKHVTFRALAERSDLCVSHSFIWYAVAVLEQLQTLPVEIGWALQFSHHKLLLPLKDREIKVRLAREAVVEKMSKRTLADRIRELRRDSSVFSRAGRPPLPAFVKGLTQVKRGIERACSEQPSDELFARYNLEDASALLDDTERDLANLTRLVSQLRARIERLRAP